MSTPGTRPRRRWPPSVACGSRCASPMTEAGFPALWASLAPIGRTPTGYYRLAWTAAELACRSWFTDQATARGLSVETDGNGNLWAWLGGPPGRTPPGSGAVVTGSHFDSVPGGGGFDGPLGIVCALLALD